MFLKKNISEIEKIMASVENAEKRNNFFLQKSSRFQLLFVFNKANVFVSNILEMTMYSLFCIIAHIL